MTGEISPIAGPVIELGPGTGPFTYALLERGVRERDLILVEFGAKFASLLRQRFPQARILEMDAAHLCSFADLKERSAGAVVSGLGLSTMPQEKVAAILDGAFRFLRPEGAFFQITYHLRCPVPRAVLDRLDLEAFYIGRTFRNLPPASVYRIARRSPALSKG
ncbi:MAG: methyltransferase domain-containing protein [Pseudomonadota bacterium]|uniref:class I SAM-dependent methyltransferase n=1 Tax=Sphingomonas sp. ERG5 TaxID=1381597 RepID=UPI001F222C6A|nr:methyltransferase domain-containing protein [Sphingomonas sp. ERG5]